MAGGGGGAGSGGGGGGGGDAAAGGDMPALQRWPSLGENKDDLLGLPMGSTEFTEACGLEPAQFGSLNMQVRAPGLERERGPSGPHRLAHGCTRARCNR